MHKRRSKKNTVRFGGLFGCNLTFFLSIIHALFNSFECSGTGDFVSSSLCFLPVSLTTTCCTVCWLGISSQTSPIRREIYYLFFSHQDEDDSTIYLLGKHEKLHVKSNPTHGAHFLFSFFLPFGVYQQREREREEPVCAHFRECRTVHHSNHLYLRRNASQKEREII